MSTRKALAPVPDPEPAKPKTVTVKVAGGTVEMATELSGEDFLALFQLTEVDPDDEAAMLKLVGPILALIERHCVSHTLDSKPILRRPLPVLTNVWAKWNEAVQANALDPTPADD